HPLVEWQDLLTADEKSMLACINAGNFEPTTQFCKIGYQEVQGGESIKITPVASQFAFARFMACELKKAHIPYAINADTQFYDGE
ncbi:hypothetical protein MJL27_26165, partial [Salmonella enterica subsp. enterica serovar Anatum]|nr:hypothetical protein [Salmonella enterica subsp. enterica serovar Anatum]